MPRIHWRTTRNNNPGKLPPITKRQNVIKNEAQGLRQLQQIRAKTNKEAYNMNHAPTETYTPIPTRAQQRMVTQQAINVLTIQEKVSTERIFTPNALMECATTHGPKKLNTMHI
jgi:hypothetical protein